MYRIGLVGGAIAIRSIARRTSITGVTELTAAGQIRLRPDPRRGGGFRRAGRGWGGRRAWGVRRDRHLRGHRAVLPKPAAQP
ncbi:MAG: hypothetical protein JO242_01665, partial [Streptosporangiaceae bacterium]|nr:hypothetical protein [Streptosporangiaceae bacterium]